MFKQIGNQGAVLPRCMVCPNINHPAPKNKGTKLQMRSPWLGEFLKDMKRRDLLKGHVERMIHGDIDKATEEIKISILRFQHGTNIFSVLFFQVMRISSPQPHALIHPSRISAQVPGANSNTPPPANSRMPTPRGVEDFGNWKTTLEKEILVYILGG